MSAASLAIRCCLLFAAIAVCTAHAGESGGALLKGASLTEDNLLAALTPRPEGVGTRKVVGRDGDATPAQQRPSASLLMTFETNSAELTPVAKRQLEIVAAALKNDRLATYSFTVEGHADPRGVPDDNQVLSEQRAQSVREYLVSAHGIAAQRLNAEGRGDREPLNRTQPAAAENRRVTIVTQLH
jgi:outer membrane protein OmpA-like peptidoglycan-associated protein